jgi:hypothetical protein
MLAAIKAVSDTHETCELRPLRYHIKKLFPICQLRAHQGPLNHCTSRDVTREFSPQKKPQEQLPHRSHGHQDPCACATYGKLADVVIFLF